MTNCGKTTKKREYTNHRTMNVEASQKKTRICPCCENVKKNCKYAKHRTADVEGGQFMNRE